MDRIMAFHAVQLLSAEYERDILPAARAAVKDRKYSWNDFYDFLGAAHEEWRFCSDKGLAERFSVAGALFQSQRVDRAVSEDLVAGKYTWARLEMFVLDFLSAVFDIKQKGIHPELTEEVVMDNGEEMAGMYQPVDVVEATAELNPRQDWEDEADGRKLSVEAVAFREWAAERFDEEAFLRKYRLISPEAETVNT